jgi:AhpD family alkylhydroperoxidase
MTEAVKQFYVNFERDMGKMREQTSEAMEGFVGLFGKVMGDGSISKMEKELVAIGIAVAVNCQPCIRLHVQKCLEAGATREQILEAASVAVMMGGGPAYTHIPEVIQALDALEA